MRPMDLHAVKVCLLGTTRRVSESLDDLLDILLLHLPGLPPKFSQVVYERYGHIIPTRLGGA